MTLYPYVAHHFSSWVTEDKIPSGKGMVKQISKTIKELITETIITDKVIFQVCLSTIFKIKIIKAASVRENPTSEKVSPNRTKDPRYRRNFFLFSPKNFKGSGVCWLLRNVRIIMIRLRKPNKILKARGKNPSLGPVSLQIVSPLV